MVKTLFITASVLTVFVVTLFFMPIQKISVTQKTPSETLPGQEFIVELTINKGTINGFSRLQQNLPAGCKAEPVNVGNAKFIFEDQFIKVVWFALPETPSFTITYKITVDNSIAGDINLSGIFSYIEKDKTKTIDIEAAIVKVTNINQTGQPLADGGKPEQTGSDASGPADAIQINRNIPDKITGDRDFVVELTVKNKSIHGSAKIVEHIPDGWTAEKIESAGSLFKSQDSLVKFIWLAMPKDTVFKISYRVTPGENIKALQSIYGTFAFDNKGTPRSFDYFPSEIASAVTDPTHVIEKKNPDDAVASAIKESIKQSPRPSEVMTTQATTISSPKTGIIYSVQMAACRKDVKDVKYFNQHYHLEDSVSAETNEGWHKYVIGSFNDYRNARDMRVNTQEKVNGTFVVAYNNGKRITVREALTVAKQKWMP